MSDVDELRDLAHQIRGLARQTRGGAGEMRAAQRVDFVSDRAARYRQDLRDHAHRADGAAGDLDDAAQALMHHAQEVEDRLAEIARIEHVFGGLLSGAQHELGKVARGAQDLAAGAVHTVSDGASQILALARHAPAPGHPDWLDFGRRLLP